MKNTKVSKVFLHSENERSHFHARRISSVKWMHKRWYKITESIKDFLVFRAQIGINNRLADAVEVPISPSKRPDGGKI